MQKTKVDNGVTATVDEASLDAWEDGLVDVARARDTGTARHPISSVHADFDVEREEAIGLLRRGVRIAPFAETTPLLPLYAKRGEPVPDELAVAYETQGYAFYFVRIVFSLSLEEDESPDEAQFLLRVLDGVSGPKASRAIDVFPGRSHKTWLAGHVGGSLGIDVSGQFSLSELAVPHAKADVSAKGEAHAKLLLGPFDFDFGQTELEVMGEGDREIGWRYKVKSALTGKNDFKSFLLLKVHKDTKVVRLLADIGVRPYRRSWKSLWIKESLPLLRAHTTLHVELAHGLPLTSLRE